MSDEVLRSAMDLAERGIAIVFLHSRSKRPVQSNWSRLPRMTPAEVWAGFRPGWNAGVRLGAPSEIEEGRFLCALDVDISSSDPHHLEEVHDWLDANFPKWRDCPRVISGSGGYSRHIYFQTDDPPPKKLLLRSKDKVEKNGIDKSAYEVELYSTGGQLVLPPSIHPVTGDRYRWEDGRGLG